jgi:hypothetical protein
MPSDSLPSIPCNYRDLVSDLVACALIEGNRHTQAAEFETKKAKQKLLDLFEAMESVGIRQERALARPAPETNSAPLFPPTEPWPRSLGEQCPQYWGRLERRCQLTEGHEGACYFCVPAYAIRTDIQIDGPSVKANAPLCSCGHDGRPGPGHQMNCPQYRKDTGKATALPGPDLSCEGFVPDPHSRFCDRCGYPEREHRRAQKGHEQA